MDEMITQLEAVAVEMKEVFGGLSKEQFNWKPDQKSWSVGQCVDHLVVTNRKEIPTIEKAVRGEHTKTFWERLPWLPGFFGGFVIKAVDPANQKKNKAPAGFRPAESDIPLSILQEYQDTSVEVIALMKAAEGMETSTMIMTSPIANFATYSVADAFKIVVLHDRRHFEQAKRLTDMASFPG